MTSVSMVSRSERVPEAFRTGGGASIAANFFLFFAVKKLPKNPPSFPGTLSNDCVFGVSFCSAAGRGLPVLGSTWTGFDCWCFSFTIAMALCPLRKSGWPVLIYVASILSLDKGINRSIRNKILDEFVCWVHCFLEESNNDVVELLFKKRISFKVLQLDEFMYDPYLLLQ